MEQDKTIHFVEAEGATVEAAVAQAADLLNVPIRRLEYEIVERGFSGFFGTVRKNWKIRAYEHFEMPEEDGADEIDADLEYVEPAIENRDGEVFVHFSNKGVLLKVTSPLGKGRRVTEPQALKALTARKVTNIDNQMVSAAVKKADGEYIQVGQFAHNSVDDAFVSVVIPDQEMKAFIHVNPPGPAGCDISFETFMSILRSNHVVFGIDQEFLKQFADKPVYRENVQIAEGLHPVNGRDSSLQYNFDLTQNRIRIRERVDGRVDFKELNIIQNVVEGQHLAKKIPPENGTAGRTITGKFLAAKSGKDLALSCLLGKGVRVADDGVTIIAGINGQVVLTSGRINVEPTYVVPGNVDITTGNIIFLGNVTINGNVEDGFSVKATGNIEVNGTVERAELDAEGDIIVHQGITGKSTGTVKTGRSLWARFIENTTVEAENMVVVSDGIINSQVDANKRILCQGKRAYIVGGRLRATEEINAKIIGSPTSGTETICEVGFDPKSKEQMDEYFIKRDSLEKKLEEIQLNLQTLIARQKQHQTLPEDKEAYLQELMDKRQDLTEELRHINEEVEKLQQFLSSQRNRGKISASSKVYPGVRIMIRDAKEDVRSEYRAVTFILENGLVRVTHYEEPDQIVKRGPDGYSAY
ncbi:MAG: FapA family protein [Treponema sp.]|nr:FapA family protein [Treponema sp.]